MGGTDNIDQAGQDRSQLRGRPGRVVWCERHYRPLLQLAALLTGDTVVAERVATDALAALPRTARAHGSEDSLRYLRQQVLIRCRRTGRYRRTPQRVRPAPPSHDPEPAFASLPVVRALRSLPASAREAIVLTHFLDLPAAQAAAIAGVSEAALRANLAAAMRALQDELTEPFLDS